MFVKKSDIIIPTLGTFVFPIAIQILPLLVYALAGWRVLPMVLNWFTCSIMRGI